MADLLIRNAHVYAPEDLGVVDIAVTGGVIEAVGPKLAVQAGQTVDATGLTALPGLIETHAHMLLPFAGTQTMNDFYDGTMSGAFGGVTTLIDFADQEKGGISPLEALDKRLALAKNCAVDYSFHITLTDLTDETIAMIPKLIERGFVSFKFYTTYTPGGLYMPPDDMQRAFAEIAKYGGIATVHAEHEGQIDEATAKLVAEGKTAPRYYPQCKPDSCEPDAVRGVLELAEKTGCRVLIRHVSSGQSAGMIARAQRAGRDVFGETCPHYLLLDDSVYQRDNAADYIVHPSIRSKADQQALWKAIGEGTVFTIGTDDCGFYLKQKRVSDKFFEVPGGMPGIEPRLAAMYQAGVVEKRISLEQLARVTSNYPARLYGLYPHKGALQVGSDADLVLIDTAGKSTITAAKLHEKSDYTPFEGMRVDMEVVATYSRGRHIVDKDRFTGEKGWGRLAKRGLPQGIGDFK